MFGDKDTVTYKVKCENFVKNKPMFSIRDHTIHNYHYLCLK